MALAHEIVPSLARREVESRREFGYALFDRLVRMVQSMAAATDAVKVGNDAPGPESAHNHGYGYYGLKRGCIQPAGVDQRTEEGLQAELLGRNLPRTFIHFAGWGHTGGGAAPAVARNLPAFDVQLNREHKRSSVDVNNIFDSEYLDIEDLAPHGCKAATFSVWIGLSEIDAGGELPIFTVRVLSNDDARIFATTSPPGNRQFFQAAQRQTATAGVTANLTIVRVNVTGVPCAPGAWNRWRINIVGNTGVANIGAFVMQVNATEEENTG